MTAKRVERWDPVNGSMRGSEGGRYVSAYAYDELLKRYRYNRQAMRRAGEYVARAQGNWRVHFNKGIEKAARAIESQIGVDPVLQAAYARICRAWKVKE